MISVVPHDSTNNESPSLLKECEEGLYFFEAPGSRPALRSQIVILKRKN